MTYARDPYDTDQPPCGCDQEPGPVLTTQEFCPAHGDPAKPAPEPPVPDWHGLHFSEMTDAQIREMAGAGERRGTDILALALAALTGALKGNDETRDFAKYCICILEDADLDRLRETFGWLDTECCEELSRRHS